MGFKKEMFVNFGAVTIVTDDRVIYQGQIIWDDEEKRHHDDDKCCPPPNVEVKVECCDPDFIILRLTCDPAIIRDNATIEEIEPDLFQEGDIILINVNEIVAVGPSRCCLGEEKKD